MTADEIVERICLVILIGIVLVTWRIILTRPAMSSHPLTPVIQQR